MDLERMIMCKRIPKAAWKYETQGRREVGRPKKRWPEQ
jgi:hypothetical protein